MKLSRIVLAVSAFSGAAFAAHVAYANSSLHTLRQIDPNPSESIASFTNVTAASCAGRCLVEEDCQAYYWVPNQGSCWLKPRVLNPERKSYEEGEGGMKVR